MNRFSNFFQFILGFFLGVLILLGGGAAIAFIFFSRFGSPPPKPIFTEEKEQPSETVATTPSPKASPKPPTSPASPSPTPTPEEKEGEKLPAGAYKARVTWSTGLSLRAEPSIESDRIGGVEYNSELIILETSSDGDWQKIRLAAGTQEGWIKAGNIEKIEE